MEQRQDLIESIFEIESKPAFEALALEVFRYQFAHNGVYNQFAAALNKTPDNVKEVIDVPFLPIELYKQFEVKSFSVEALMRFLSSGTTAHTRSIHYVHDVSVYERSIEKCFYNFFGNPQDFVILALLPSYLENAESSLIYMMHHLMQVSSESLGGFCGNDFNALKEKLTKCKQAKKNIFLIGTPFSLLSFGEQFAIDLSGHIVVETGGMKGQMKEIVREELHAGIKTFLKADKVISEYGMTEMFSQAWALDNGEFSFPPWASFFIVDPTDPFSFAESGTTGTLNIIDLANIDTCSFIATQDLALSTNNKSFSILGRVDHSDVRGCSQLML